MIKIEIDGQTIELEEPIPVIEAARLAGMDVAQYCYHPKLSIAGQCRMCVCKLEEGGRMNPKLQISCNTIAKDGMKVWFKDPEVQEVVRGVLELHLVNHPIDCPICDQAGECKLQDFYMEHGLHQSRVHLDDKMHRDKYKRIGRDVVLDNERCIMCTRCVRFFNEITEEKELVVEHRGNHSEIKTTFDSLKSHYSQNVVDICPVGALTDDRFRFKQRVWFLEEADSVCPGCSKGCNVFVHHKDQTIYRVKPRPNEEVNQVWLCDQSRVSFGYPGMGERMGSTSFKRYGMNEPAPWKTSVEFTQGAISGKDGGEVVIVGSAWMTNEALFLLKEIAGKAGVSPYATVKSFNPDVDGLLEDDFLIKADKNPNTKGAKLLGYKTLDESANAEAFLAELESGKVKTLWVAGIDPSLSMNIDPARYEAALQKVETVIYQSPFQGPTQNKAILEMPSAAHYETNGTITNLEGRVQAISTVIWPLGDSRMDWEILGRVLEGIDPTKKFSTLSQVTRALAEGVDAFKSLDPEKLTQEGALV